MLSPPIFYLNSNNGHSILAFGEGAQFSPSSEKLLDDIESFIGSNKNRYIFMCLPYDLKNDIEKLTSNNNDSVQFPEAFLWTPTHVIQIETDSRSIEYLQGEINEFSQNFIKAFLNEQERLDHKPLGFTLSPRTKKLDYLNHVEALKEEIQQGNIYEINYCQEFYAENAELKEPLNKYFKLNALTKAPYSAYVETNDFNILSGSPERFIKRDNVKLVSSPIKGTSKRGKTNTEDEQLKEQLLNDPKERAENVMIVDLVRNDLSRIATKGSVKVDELFGIYSYETVHQMISTISCEIRPETNFTDILRATFPMGSMTGAPKISAMNLIEKHEDFKRGIYSGSIGYIKPNGNFDLNVVIRSIVYNKKRKYLSCAVGGAITNKSSAESEFDECLIKIEKILDGMNR